VGQFVQMAFDRAGLDWRPHVEIDPRYFRPTEVDYLKGDSSRARERLAWEPQVGFEELVRMMVDNDLELARQERTLRDAGHSVHLRGTASA
jgi:GDPmannose 4,6-dehydratase